MLNPYLAEEDIVAVGLAAVDGLVDGLFIYMIKVNKLKNNFSSSSSKSSKYKWRIPDDEHPRSRLERLVGGTYTPP